MDGLEQQKSNTSGLTASLGVIEQIANLISDALDQIN